MMTVAISTNLLRILLLHLMLLMLMLLMLMLLMLLLLLLLLRSYLSNGCHLRSHGAFLRRRRGEHGRVSRLLLREGAKHLLLLLQLKLFQWLVESGAAYKLPQIKDYMHGMDERRGIGSWNI